MSAHSSFLLAALLAGAAAAPSRAAIRAEARILIHAPVERVWTLVTDVDRWPAWNPAVERAHLAGAAVAGGVFDWKSGGVSVRSTFRDLTPTHRIVWTGVAFGTRAVHGWTFTNTPDGVVVTTEETFDGWLPALFPKMMQAKLDQTLPALLKSLKAAAEGSPEL